MKIAMSTFPVEVNVCISIKYIVFIRDNKQL